MTTLDDRPRPSAESTEHDAYVPSIVKFEDGDASMAALMGGKGANLAEMTRLGLPVPAGFTLTTEVCRQFLRGGRLPLGLPQQIRHAVGEMEARTGRAYGSPIDPLLVSVRSGARFSMPGMMETVLNVGLTDASVGGLARRGGERFAWDCYRRLVQMFGSTVLGVDDGLFRQRLEAARTSAGAATDADLDAATLRRLTEDFRQILRDEVREDLPQDPMAQLERAVAAVFASWNGRRARVYRAHEGIPDDLGTAVNVVAMIYGNTGPRSGSGVCFTRNPSTGAATPFGDYLPDAQGEDVVNGSRSTLPLERLADLHPGAYRQLIKHLHTLERHYRDMCDVEFTIEGGRLWLLQTRIGKRSPAAAFVIADAMAREGIIDKDEALVRVDGHQLEQLLHPRFNIAAATEPYARGLGASPGASAGVVVLEPEDAVALRRSGKEPVLVRMETSAEDLDGMIASTAVVTARGGLASHAAVVARGLGRTCVVSVSGMVVDPAKQVVHLPDGRQLQPGDVVSVDGTTGHIFRGQLDIVPSVVAAALESESDVVVDADAPLVAAARRILAHADRRRRLGVRANAERPDDAQRARRLGAEGIGLCRTEHMLLGPRRELVERILVGRDRAAALDEVERLALADFLEILEVMDGMPVVVRLLDPPLHEFLPDLVELTEEVATQRATGSADPALEARAAAAAHWHEANPMLGLRGVRLLTTVPELVDVHVRALTAATARLVEQGLDPRPEIMIPLVADAAEMHRARERVVRIVKGSDRAGNRRIPVGSMIELPRAALTAGDIAAEADFFSFGTNDLTQTTWGLSRDDAASFLTAYIQQGILGRDPFETLDVDGVGELIRTAITRGRAAKPSLVTGACGEHAGDPESITFFADEGLDYVSCSAPRIPVARLSAGRAAVLRGRRMFRSDA
jgi:pyruvate,orthophosphate dikinase